MERRYRQSQETLVVGNGPAALGVPIACLKAIEETSNANVKIFNAAEPYPLGLQIIGPEASLGRGSLDYQVNSNSGGLDFIEDLPDCLKRRLAEDENFKALLLAGNNPAPLVTVANVQHEVAKALIAELALQSGTAEREIYRDDVVSYLRYQAEADTLLACNDKGQVVSGGKNVIVSIGAEQDPLDLGSNDHKRILSDDFLRLNPIELSGLNGKSVTIVGGSHSAFSALHNIRQHAPKAIVKIIHRRPVALFFPNETAAQANGYNYDETALDDGKINRFNGVREDAKQAYLAVLSGQDTNTLLQQVEDLEEAKNLGQADVIVQATGYTPKRIPIFDAQGKVVVAPEIDRNEFFNPIRLGGARVFSNGIAQTQRDGVNLFQGEFADKILHQLPASHTHSLTRGALASA